MVDKLFAALADPTRRHVFAQLASSGPSTATALASDLDVSRQAVAKHLGILADAGMAESQRVGRETRFEAVVAPLGEVHEWIRQVEGEWNGRLAALAEVLKPQTEVTD